VSPRSADRLRVYLAGPDIFVPDAAGLVARKKAICDRYELIGVSPLDPWPDEPADGDALPDWRRIALRNEAQIRSADLMIANLTPFRGPSADVGTVYEVAMMRTLRRPVFGYATTAVGFTRRTADFASRQGGVVAGADGSLRDGEGLLIEQFGLFDNLMIEAGIVSSGGALIVDEIAPASRWTDLSVFERCVEAAIKALSRAARLAPAQR
jgi:nucleoside 2-deoxyribosyltransferase